MPTFNVENLYVLSRPYSGHLLCTCPCYSHPANANKSLCTVWFACRERWCYTNPNVHERCIVYITEVSAENRAGHQSRPKMTEKGKEKHWLEFWLCLGRKVGWCSHTQRLSVWTPHLHQRRERPDLPPACPDVGQREEGRMRLKICQQTSSQEMEWNPLLLPFII